MNMHASESPKADVAKPRPYVPLWLLTVITFSGTLAMHIFVPALPHARYRLVSATLTASPRHPVGAFLGDLLVRESSAYGRRRGSVDLFPGAETLHVPKADHFDLLNHPAVHDALRRWLA